MTERRCVRYRYFLSFSTFQSSEKPEVYVPQRAVYVHLTLVSKESFSAPVAKTLLAVTVIVRNNLAATLFVEEDGALAPLTLSFRLKL